MNAFITFLNGLFGTYTPVVGADGSIAPGMAGLDIPYICRAVLFIIIIHSIFKLIGGIICKTY